MMFTDCRHPGCAAPRWSIRPNGYCRNHQEDLVPYVCVCDEPDPHRLWQLVGCRTCKRVIL